MFKETLQEVHKRLRRHDFFERIFVVLEKTPSHAVHWYLLMIVGLVVVVVNVSLAWFVFRSVSLQEGTELGQVNSTVTISREVLQKALDTYQARAVELERLKQAPPRIIDPGR